MKYGILFLVSACLLAACETSNVPSANAVAAPTKFECAKIDASFVPQGDTCASICVACEKGGGTCVDTDKNFYGDTCAKSTTNCLRVYWDEDGDGFGDADNSACDSPKLTKHWVHEAGDCDIWNPTIHPKATDECADHIDNNCDGYTDETCADIAKVDPNFLALVFVYPKSKTSSSNLYYEFVADEDHLSNDFDKNQPHIVLDDPSKGAVILYPPADSKLIRFSNFDDTGDWSTCYIKDGQFAVYPPTLYEVKGGVWTNRTANVNGLVSKHDANTQGALLCSALFAF